MVLTERKEYIELLAEMMTNKGIHVVELHGGISTKQRQARIALLSNKPSNNEPVVTLAMGNTLVKVLTYLILIPYLLRYQ